jgi:hypothetical protein
LSHDTAFWWSHCDEARARSDCVIHAVGIVITRRTDPNGDCTNWQIRNYDPYGWHRDHIAVSYGPVPDTTVKVPTESTDRDREGTGRSDLYGISNRWIVPVVVKLGVVMHRAWGKRDELLLTVTT